MGEIQRNWGVWVSIGRRAAWDRAWAELGRTLAWLAMWDQVGRAVAWRAMWAEIGRAAAWPAMWREIGRSEQSRSGASPSIESGRAARASAPPPF